MVEDWLNPEQGETIAPGEGEAREMMAPQVQHRPGLPETEHNYPKPGTSAQQKISKVSVHEFLQQLSSHCNFLLIRLQTRRTCVQDPGLLATPEPALGPRDPAQPQPGPREPVLGPETVPEVERVSGSLVTPVSPLEFRDLLVPPTWHLRPRTLRIPDARDPKWFIPTEKTL